MDENISKIVVPVRAPTAAAIKRINSLLNITEDQYSQDWEFEISEFKRLPEYLGIYENQLINEDERFALMSVIVDASNYEDLDENMWGRIREHLKSEFALHRFTIFYWCCMGEENLEYCFYITPRLRELWSECEAD